MTKYSQLYTWRGVTGAIPGRTHGSSGVHKDLWGELEPSANDNYYEPAKPLQTPPPMSVAQRCAAIEARLREKQFHTESSTVTVSPNSVTDLRQHAQHTLDSQQHLQYVSTASRGEAPATQQQLIHIHQATSTASAASYQFDEATRETQPLAKGATVTLDDIAANIHHRQPAEPTLGCGLLELGPDGAWHFTDAPAPAAAQEASTQQPRTRSQLPRPRPHQKHATPLTGAIGEAYRPPLQCSALGPTCAWGRGLLALLDAEEQKLPTPPPPCRRGTAGGVSTPITTTAIDSHPPPSEEAQEDRRELDRASCPEGVSASSESQKKEHSNPRHPSDPFPPLIRP